MITSTTYLVYIAISVFITIFVSRTLSRNGKAFLIDGFNGNDVLAESVNHLLVVGFYLINMGFVLLRMRTGTTITSLEHAIVYLSSGIGAVLVILGIAHFFNMFLISRFRTAAIERAERADRASRTAISSRPNYSENLGTDHGSK